MVVMQYFAPECRNMKKKKNKLKRKNLYPSVLLKIPCFGLIITDVSLVTVSMHSMLANAAACRTAENATVDNTRSIFIFFLSQTFLSIYRTQQKCSSMSRIINAQPLTARFIQIDCYYCVNFRSYNSHLNRKHGVTIIEN